MTPGDVPAPEPSLRSRRLRGTFLVLSTPALVACFLPVALGLSPADMVAQLGLSMVSPDDPHALVLDTSTRLLLLSLAIGACSPLVVLPWRVLLAWRFPGHRAVVAIGRGLLALLAVTNALALALLLMGVLQRDTSMIAPLVGELVGLGTLATLALPAWRALPAEARLACALGSAYVGSTLALVATFASRPELAWWLLSAGAIVAAAEIALMPREMEADP